MGKDVTGSEMEIADSYGSIGLWCIRYVSSIVCLLGRVLLIYTIVYCVTPVLSTAHVLRTVVLGCIPLDDRSRILTTMGL